jgi:hypothetical protein
LANSGTQICIEFVAGGNDNNATANIKATLYGQLLLDSGLPLNYEPGTKRGAL